MNNEVIILDSDSSISKMDESDKQIIDILSPLPLTKLSTVQSQKEESSDTELPEIPFLKRINRGVSSSIICESPKLEMKSRGKEIDKKTKNKRKIVDQEEKKHAKELKRINKKRVKDQAIQDIEVVVDNKIVDEEFRIKLGDHGAKISRFEGSSICPIIRLKRHSDSEWDEDSRQYIPVNPPKVTDEPYAIFVWNGDDFLAKIKENRIFEFHEEWSMRNLNFKALYIFDQIEEALKKQERLAQRDFRKAVMDSKNSGMNEASKYITRMDFDSILLDLQLSRNFGGYFCSKKGQMYDDIIKIIKTIAIKPYWLQSAANGSVVHSLCIGPSGLNNTDTFQKMLQEVLLLTKSIADSITKHYPTINTLYSAFLDSQDESLLAEIPISGSKANRKIGLKMSQKIYRLFMNENPKTGMYRQ
ncbi:hypothetical protein ROZALSC1DRAFT_26670 [Rozella allomycis CSF55]|uniref:Uncharacterized protein n=1 Tax=Rozella allomycis (strain CSF55) TaxID=988480 RepID=A0A4P9YQ76_ROZAC|nr:hypothetical protein ROZALSC1DRAFT_26670 [Rozella allomycis CSF55]